MRLYTEIDARRSRVLVTFRGAVTLHDVREMMSTSSKARVLAFPTLMDLRNVTIALSPDDIAEILRTAREMALQSPIAKCAVLVSDLENLHRVEEVCQVLGQVSPLKGFLQRIEAESWLGWQV